jgi:MFS family permease
MSLDLEKEEEPIKTKFYYGWLILFMSALAFFFSGPGQTYSISIFIDHYIKEFGWSRSLVSSLYSGGTLISGLILTFMGKKIDKYGHRKMIVIISLFLGAATLWMSFVFNPFMLLIGFFLMRFFGQGSMGLWPQTLVPHWFKSKRGLAMSLLGIGGVVGAAVIPPLNNYLINLVGISNAWRFWTLALILIMAPAGWFFVRNKPENIGLKIDGINEEEEDSVSSKYAPRVHISNDPWTLNEAMKTKEFWLVIYLVVIPSMINTGITFHIVSIIGEKGYSAAFAAYILSITSMIKFPLTFLGGYILDRVKVRLVKVVNFAFLIAAILLIIKADTKSAFMIYALVHGSFMAFDGVSTSVMLPNYFGKKNLGSIRGFFSTAMVIGSALGPLPFGLAYDYFNGYTEVMLLVMVLPILALGASYLATPPKYKKMK